MTTLRDDVRRVADAFEAAAPAQAAVVDRLHGRARARRALIPGIAVLAVVAAVLVGVVVRELVTTPNAGAPVMPDAPGLFRSIEPDATGRCFAVLVYDTTRDDGRVALWAWIKADDCSARSTNLYMAVGRATAVGLPANGSTAARSGIDVVAGPDAEGPLGGLAFVLDPLASTQPERMPAFHALDEVAGQPTLELVRMESIDIPYRVP